MDKVYRTYKRAKSSQDIEEIRERDGIKFIGTGVITDTPAKCINPHMLFWLLFATRIFSSKCYKSFNANFLPFVAIF